MNLLDLVSVLQLLMRTDLDLAFRNTFIETFPDFAGVDDVFRLLRMRFSVVYGDGEEERESAAHTRLRYRTHDSSLCFSVDSISRLCDRVISAIKEILETHDFSTPEELLVLGEIDIFLHAIAPEYPGVLHILELVQPIVCYNFGSAVARLMH